VAFRGRHEGRLLLDLPAGDEHARVLALLGDRWGRDLVPVDVTAAPMSLRGWVGRADVHRPTRDGIHVLVNRRPVRDPFLMRAVSDAFRNTLPPGRFPVAVLYLDLPPGEVDVNVHPAKSEVRFQRLREVRALVTGGLSEALGGEGARPHLPGSTTLISGGPSSPSQAWEAPGGERARERAEQAYLTSTNSWQRSLGDALPEMRAPSIRALAQFRECYILAEDAEGLLIVDQHVAHERYLYEKLLQEAEGGALPRQASLFPAVLEVGPERAELVPQHRELLLRCGFRVEPFGGDSVRVAEVPAVMGRDTRPEAVVTILDQILDGEKRFSEPMLNQLLATVACHTAVRKGQALSIEKMDYLLKGLESCEAPHHCPHGRAVSMRVDLAALDRVFGRT
jgi:DNA mismatch repair protein MutL